MTNLDRDLKHRPQVLVSYASDDSTAAKAKERGEDPCDLIVDIVERFYLQHE
jgi:hypothetical protein